MATIAYILLGSNQGDSAALLPHAIQHLTTAAGSVLAKSSVYQTAAWGNVQQNDFLNQVIKLRTQQDARQLMQTCLAIEAEMGRVRTIKNAPRTIDIDILFFGKKVINLQNLIIPHKEIANRRFVLIPLAELAAGFVHPVLHKTVHTLLQECNDPLPVKKL